MSAKAAQRVLMNQFRGIMQNSSFHFTYFKATIVNFCLVAAQRDPVEGVLFELRDDDLFSWKVYLEGPQDTPYVGGVYELTFKFPPTYPYDPPTLQFESEFWHPNVSCFFFFRFFSFRFCTTRNLLFFSLFVCLFFLKCEI